MSVDIKRLAAVTSAYTGVLIAKTENFNFSDVHEYIEEVMGGPVFTHEMGSTEFVKVLKEKSKPEFLKLWEEALSESV